MNSSNLIKNGKELGANWYYANNNNQNGPISKNKLYGMFMKGELDPETLVWSPSMKDWTPAIQVESFQLKATNRDNLYLTYKQNDNSYSSKTRNTLRSRNLSKQLNIQKAILFAVAALSTIMMIFPPFKIQVPNRTFNMGYAFLLDPPKRYHFIASVNVELLLIQLLILVICGLSLWLAFKNNRQGI